MPQEFTQAQLEAAARSLLTKRVLSKGGKQPSALAVDMVVRTLALRAMREAKDRATSPASDSEPAPPASS